MDLAPNRSAFIVPCFLSFSWSWAGGFCVSTSQAESRFWCSYNYHLGVLAFFQIPSCWNIYISLKLRLLSWFQTVSSGFLWFCTGSLLEVNNIYVGHFYFRPAGNANLSDSFCLQPHKSLLTKVHFVILHMFW